jgi:hypothetical protein
MIFAYFIFISFSRKKVSNAIRCESILDDLAGDDDSRRVHGLVRLGRMLALAALVQLVSQSESIEIHSSVPFRVSIDDWIRIFGLNLPSLPEEEGPKHGERCDCH